MERRHNLGVAEGGARADQVLRVRKRVVSGVTRVSPSSPMNSGRHHLAGSEFGGRSRSRRSQHNFSGDSESSEMS